MGLLFGNDKNDDSNDTKLTGWAWGKDDTTKEQDSDTPGGWLTNWLNK